MLLVGGASRRFGSPKALVEVDGERLVDRGSRVLAEACDEVLVVGKPGELPFDVLPDAGEVRAPIAGVVAGLRAAAHDVVVFLPVDCPWMTGEALRALGDACRDAAVPADRPAARVPGRRRRCPSSSAAWRQARTPSTAPTTSWTWPSCSSTRVSSPTSTRLPT